MKLPDAERLCEQLVAELRPRIGPKTAMVGLYTGGAWLAERFRKRRIAGKALQRANEFPLKVCPLTGSSTVAPGSSRKTGKSSNDVAIEYLYKAVQVGGQGAHVSSLRPSLPAWSGSDRRMAGLRYSFAMLVSIP